MNHCTDEVDFSLKTTPITRLGFDHMLFPAMHCVDSNENFGAHDLGMHIVSLCALTSDQFIPVHGASGGHSDTASKRPMRQEYPFNQLAWRSPSTAITLCCPIVRIITDETML